MNKIKREPIIVYYRTRRIYSVSLKIQQKITTEKNPTNKRLHKNANEMAKKNYLNLIYDEKKFFFIFSF